MIREKKWKLCQLDYKFDPFYLLNYLKHIYKEIIV